MTSEPLKTFQSNFSSELFLYYFNWNCLTTLRGLYTLVRFFAISAKGDNFFDFLFASLYAKPLLKLCLLYLFIHPHPQMGIVCKMSNCVLLRIVCKMSNCVLSRIVYKMSNCVLWRNNKRRWKVRVKNAIVRWKIDERIKLLCSVILKAS